MIDGLPQLGCGLLIPFSLPWANDGHSLKNASTSPRIISVCVSLCVSLLSLCVPGSAVSLGCLSVDPCAVLLVNP